LDLCLLKAGLEGAAPLEAWEAWDSGETREVASDFRGEADGKPMALVFGDIRGVEAASSKLILNL